MLSRDAVLRPMVNYGDTCYAWIVANSTASSYFVMFLGKYHVAYIENAESLVNWNHPSS